MLPEIIVEICRNECLFIDKCNLLVINFFINMY